MEVVDLFASLAGDPWYLMFDGDLLNWLAFGLKVRFPQSVGVCNEGPQSVIDLVQLQAFQEPRVWH